MPSAARAGWRRSARRWPRFRFPIGPPTRTDTGGSGAPRDSCPRALGVLRALYLQREAWARAEHRPPFKVLSPETLIALAERQPAEPAALVGVPGLSPRLVERYGASLLAAVAQGLAERPPEPPRVPRPARPVVTTASRQRAEAVRKWRAEAAETSGLDPGVLLPQRLIDALALDPPASLAGLAAVPGLRRWRVDGFGPAILAALRTT